MAWSLLIRNGTVVDGSGAPGSAADVAVEGDRIVAIEPRLTGEARRTIDAAGLAVAPGFIDIHSHSDLFYLGCPAAESKLRQGVTTEVVGMCSFSPAPVHPARKAVTAAWIGEIGSRLAVEWETFGQYLDRLRRAGPSINIVHFVGHGALRLAALGPENRPPSPHEQGQMERLLDEALEAGAFGFSTGLVYPPSAYAVTAELVALARSMAHRRGLYFSHIRGEAATLEAAIDEAIRIGEGAGVPVQIAHIKASGRENWTKMDAALRKVSDARARGVDVHADAYPYAAGSTKMANLLPAWVHDGGNARLLERLGDGAARRRLIEEGAAGGEGWRSVNGSLGWGDIMIATCSQRELEGLRLSELAERRGRPAAETMLDLLVEEAGQVAMVVFSQAEENVVKALAHPHVMIGSDSIGLSAGPGPHPGKPHPRMYGTFPRVLGHYARERRLFSVETAVNKMTGMPAAKLRLKNRGLVRAGYAADLTLFEPTTVRDEATYTDPHRHPTGIPYVIVNGQVVVDSGAMKPLPVGRILAP
ncbi:MAG: D-aminoacylase [Candidatus Rokubacteria bacterium]|nr:D-aminoacylase [Candidatus Rokubacteria bacterium]